MSATRDTSQKIGFVKGNLYQIKPNVTNEPEAFVNLFTYEPLRNGFIELHRLHQELKRMIDELEALVKE